MKLLLLQPPIQDFYDTDIRLQPIGLAYLKATVKKFLPHVDVIIRDYHHGRGRKTVSLPDELQYLREYYRFADRSPFSTFYHFYHFGASYQLIAEEVLKEKPDLVGISSLFTPYWREVLETARAIKKKWSCPILAGGSHVSADPLHLLQYPEIDFVIRGEGERPLVEFLKIWQENGDLDTVPNLGFKKNGLPVLNEVQDNYDLDTLPLPDLTDFDPNRYSCQKKPLTFIITSRGCPHHCAFCSVHLTFGQTYRRRNVEKIMDEIRYRYQQGYRVFDFEDDNLTFYLPEMKEICRRLVQLFPPGEIACTAMNGISYLSLDSELLNLMRQAGFRELNISLVSADIDILTGHHRSAALKKYSEVVHIAHELEFRIVSYQILGLPDDTLQSMVQTMIFNSRLPVLLGVSPFYLTPRMPIAARFPPLTPEDMIRSRLTALGYQGSGHNRDDLYTLFITARIINFLKGLEFDKLRVSLNEIVCQSKNKSTRAMSALKVLGSLVNEKILYAETAAGLKPIHKFKIHLFFDLWQKLEYITTRSNCRIQLEN